MATEIAAQMVRLQITGAAQHPPAQMVRFYLNVPSPIGMINRFNIRDAASLYPVEGEFSNITFLYNNLFDSAVVTTSSNHRKFPGSRMQHRWGTYHWRSWGDPLGDPRPDALANQWIKADLGLAQDVRAILVWYHNFYNGASVSIQGNAVDAWAGPLLDEGITLYDVNYPIVKLWDAAQNHRWWRIPIDGDWLSIITEGDFNEAESYFDYARIGRVFIGDYFRPIANFNRSYVPTEEDDSMILQTIENQSVSNVTSRYKTIAYEFEDVCAADFAKFMAMWNMVGTATPFWIVQNAGRWYDQTYYVTFMNQIGFKRKSGGTPKYDLRIMVEEVS